jgi:DNA-3-methyladenine glycosylase
VAEPKDQPGCVLIRAIEPLTGIDVMQKRRPAAKRIEDLASGPGKLTRAMGITPAQNGADVTHGDLVVRSWKRQPKLEVEVTPRIGIRHCADWPLRYVVKGSEFVSR